MYSVLFSRKFAGIFLKNGHKVIIIGVCNQGIEGQLAWVHVLVLHRLELIVHNDELDFTDNKDVASYAARVRDCSCDLQLYTILGIHELEAAAVQIVVLNGPEIDEQTELVPCVELCRFHDALACFDDAPRFQHTRQNGS